MLAVSTGTEQLYSQVLVATGNGMESKQDNCWRQAPMYIPVHTQVGQSQKK